ncbi:phosphotransferase [Ornithinimicrobium sp. Arc0846-15]|nr:phosphotransferase [Ornithinimicrobium laminariae]
MTHSDLALAGIACAAVPGMQPVSVQEWRRPEATDPSPAQRALVEDATGRRWVVIVPRTAAGAAELERNDALTRQLGKHLPFKVPVATGFAAVGQAGRAAVFPYVEGSAINFHRIPAGPGLSSAIGRSLAAVHNMPSDFFDEFGVPTFDAESHRQRRLADLDRAAETGLVPGELLSRWELAFDTASLWRFAATPVHGSLNGWSFLVAFSDDEAATARVVALTSWEHACVSDPADDFAMLVKQATPAAVDSVLESYTLARANRPDRNLLIRARLASEMSMLRGLAGAVSADDQEFVNARVDELRKLSRLTSADDPLVPGTVPVVTALPEAGLEEQTDDQLAVSDGAHALRSVPPLASGDADNAERDSSSQDPGNGAADSVVDTEREDSIDAMEPAGDTDDSDGLGASPDDAQVAVDGEADLHDAIDPHEEIDSHDRDAEGPVDSDRSDADADVTTEIPVLSPAPAPAAPDDEDSTTVIKTVAWPPPAQGDVPVEYELPPDADPDYGTPGIEITDTDVADADVADAEVADDEMVDQEVPAEDERPEPDYRSEANALNIPPPKRSDETSAEEPSEDAIDETDRIRDLYGMTLDDVVVEDSPK